MGAAINLQTDPTLDAVNAAIEADQSSRPRDYLGLSGGPGIECPRKLWYRFRWVATERFDADTLRKFEDGHRTEDLMASRLRAVDGITLHATDPATGKQIAVKSVGGHVAGHLDGAILGVIQAPKTWHVWEHKCCADKVQAALLKAIDEHGEKNALEHWNGVYFSQAQLYMHLTGMKRHYLTVDTPGGRSTISCRTDYQPARAKAFLAEAERIVFATSAPPRISDNPTWYKCKWCNFHDICHGQDLPRQVSCRTCVHSTPNQNGGWDCEKHQAAIPDRQAQENACPAHRFIPDLMPGTAIAADDTAEWIEYQDLVNGPHPDTEKPCWSSREIAAAQSIDVLTDARFDAFRQAFAAELVG